MICPTCQAVATETTTVCPVCERPLTARPEREHGASGRRVRIIEGSISASTTMPLGEEDTLPDVLADAAAQPMPQGETLPVPVAPTPVHALVPLLRAVPRLTALAWEQPAVRAAVRTGASAVAVSVATRVATRLATRWLAGQLGREAAQPRALDMLPMLTDALGDKSPLPALRRGRRQSITVETFVYIRRTISAD